MDWLKKELLLLKKDLIAFMRELHELDPLEGDTTVQNLMKLVRENIEAISKKT